MRAARLVLLSLALGAPIAMAGDGPRRDVRAASSALDDGSDASRAEACGKAKSGAYLKLRELCPSYLDESLVAYEVYRAECRCSISEVTGSVTCEVDVAGTCEKQSKVFALFGSASAASEAVADAAAHNALRANCPTYLGTVTREERFGCQADTTTTCYWGGDCTRP